VVVVIYVKVPFLLEIHFCTAYIVMKLTWQGRRRDMIDLRGELSAAQRVVLAVDTSDLGRARELASLAHDAGASLIKQGLELASAPGSSWEFSSQNAAEAGLDWVADTKGDDISATMGGLIKNIVRLDHPPVAITMHTHAGIDSMREAQKITAEHGIVMLGVTELTSVKEEELRRQFGFVLAKLGLGGLSGLVASAKELINPIKSDPELATMFTMIPGTRSPGAAVHDQNNVEIPEEAIAKGADLLVIGREVTGSNDPSGAFKNVEKGIQRGLDRRAAA
jgi:orotidine-5'-phosphate decarboxylase